MRNGQTQEDTMYISQADLFHGLNSDFVRRIMELAVRIDYQRGDSLFKKGDPAEYFFVLLKGNILLSPDEIGEVVHSIGRAGESFGWSSIVGGKIYTATAQCQAPAKVIQFDAEALREILENDPAQGMIFYRRLAASLGVRLVQSYRSAMASSEAETSVSFGARNLVEAELA
jgi:CRP/FNR family cyclic AMP-dependent transcriptional regulator